MSFLKFTASTIFIALFVIAIIAFAINFGIDNNATVNLGQDPDFSTLNTSMQNEVEDFYTQSNVSVDAFMKSTISSQTQASEGGTQYKVTTGNSLSMAKNGITNGFTKIFGSDSGFGVILTALISFLTLAGAAFAYKAWVGRDPGN